MCLSVNVTSCCLNKSIMKIRRMACCVLNIVLLQTQFVLFTEIRKSHVLHLVVDSMVCNEKRVMGQSDHLVNQIVDGHKA